MQSLGRILVAGAIVVLILGFVALPSTLGYYGHQQSKHNGMDHSAMMQENLEGMSTHGKKHAPTNMPYDVTRDALLLTQR